MSTQANYTQQEWSTLVNAPMTAAGGVIAVDFGVLSFVKELRAAAAFIQEARAQYSGNELIQAIARACESTEASEDSLPSPEQALPQLQEAVSTLARKSPGELAEFKAFVYGLAERVAQAAGEGFLGTGDAVSEKERSFLSELKKALGT